MVVSNFPPELLTSLVCQVTDWLASVFGLLSDRLVYCLIFQPIWWIDLFVLCSSLMDRLLVFSPLWLSSCPFCRLIKRLIPQKTYWLLCPADLGTWLTASLIISLTHLLIHSLTPVHSYSFIYLFNHFHHWITYSHTYWITFSMCKWLAHWLLSASTLHILFLHFHPTYHVSQRDCVWCPGLWDD